MSKGPGRIERAIVAAFAAEPDNGFSVDDLCDRAFPNLEVIERKHRVTVLRAAKRLVARGSHSCVASEAVGGALMFFDPYRVMSYAMARKKALGRYRTGDPRIMAHWRKTEVEIRAALSPGGPDHHLVAPGGGWWKHVEEWKAERDGDHDKAREIHEEREAELRRLGFGIRQRLDELAGA